ncbi:hypothetical protein QBC35DRAFT_58566 [Podospora australis]|uniref:Cyanovirin-N domain-containing protein n=1 Tax=Podospora australis TaxID=1536484 RepID=A0AAN7AF78_9PEZI|nr:hypothetical protein QBC35DRAFT_58566 [Podospora australis]
MKLTTIFTVGLVALAETASAGFIDSCNSDWYWDRNFMIANCRKTDGTIRRTRQDMNLCVGTVNGVLVPQNTGNAFVAACGPGTKVAPTSVQAQCQRNVPGLSPFVTTTLNLNTFVENNNGFLHCFGHNGAPF